MIPFFSVVIPLYNKENYIYNTLKSVLSQSFQDFEIIIVNDGSTDGSLGELSRIQDHRIQVLNQTNKNVSDARNLGIKHANANYIALLDADDIWYPNHLEDSKKLIESFPNCGLYCTAYDTLFYSKTIVNGQYSGIDDDFFGIVPDYFANSLIDGIALTSAVVIPKDIINKYGGFNTHIRSGQDTDLWIQIALKEPVAFTSRISMRRVISDTNNHLSLSSKRVDKILVVKKFKTEEKNNSSFKRYMDHNRFAIAMERKMSGDKENFKSIVKDINVKHLNAKQKAILALPGWGIKQIKRFQIFLIKNKVYLSPFR